MRCVSTTRNNYVYVVIDFYYSREFYAGSNSYRESLFDAMDEITNSYRESLFEYTRGHHMRFTQPFTRIDSYLYSFFPSSIKLWNALPNHILNSTNIEQFKQRIAGLSIN